ncbi:alpha/beta fold hydrolase [Streptomyces sp. NPDC050848]|uniref:alpha/beta fold hydrolase n=1 Tax=Streptomyces sp. NPDC050848 TaxID=3155791 RepID=UPI003402122D
MDQGRRPRCCRAPTRSSPGTYGRVDGQVAGSGRGGCAGRGRGASIDLYLEADKFRAAFAADLPLATTRLLQATQRPFRAACFTDTTASAAWRTIPSWGLVADTDKAIPPALQRFFYDRARARHVVEARGASHVAMISHPRTTARLIEQAARANA